MRSFLTVATIVSLIALPDKGQAIGRVHWSTFVTHRTEFVVVGGLRNVDETAFTERSDDHEFGHPLYVYGAADIEVHEVLYGTMVQTIPVTWYQTSVDGPQVAGFVPPRYTDGYKAVWILNESVPSRGGRYLLNRVPLDSLDAVRAHVETIPRHVEPPVVIHEEPAVYPPEALKQGIEGAARVAVFVEVDGSVSDVVLVSLTDDIFKQATLDAIAKYRFKPARGDGEPMRMRVLIPVNFRLDDQGGRSN